jgi:hypothetical protein
MPADPNAQIISLRVVAQDTGFRDADGRVLTEWMRIPAEHLEYGPRGARFHVVDYDRETGMLEPPMEIKLGDDDPYADPGDASDAALSGDPAFRARNVYAVAAATLATFEAALGRRISWRSPGHRIYLVPRAFAEANAGYHPSHGAIYFGYVPGEDGEHLTCLSYDIVAHEISHAILDGLRPHFIEPGLPDQAGFHEALGDCVALLSVFAHGPVVERLLSEKAGSDEVLPAAALDETSLRATALMGLAEGLGMRAGRGDALRRSVELDPRPSWRGEPELGEPHNRGEVFVSAVALTLLEVWLGRIEALKDDSGGADLARVAEEGSKAAAHLLKMILRGIDYMPPVDLEFEDVLEAVLTADEVVAPDDEKHGYRKAVADRFAAWGIKRPADGIVDVSRAALRYGRINAAVLRSDRDEALRFLWENADAFELNRTWHTEVEFLRPSVRIGPDGLLVSELIVGYTQTVQLTAAEGREAGIEIAADVDNTVQLQLWGGGVVVFDQFGRAKLHQRKLLEDWPRQSRRIAQLRREGQLAASGEHDRGAAARDELFAALHPVGDEVEVESR